MNPPTTAESVPYWRVPTVLLEAAVRSSSLLAHDLVNRFTVERFQLFLAGYLAMYGGAGVLLPLWQYLWVLRSAWFLAIAAICIGQCLVLATALALARRGDIRNRSRWPVSVTGSPYCSSRSSHPPATGDGAGCCGACRFRPALHPLAARPGLRGDHRGLRIGAGGVSPFPAFRSPFRGTTPLDRDAFILVALPVHAFHLLIIAFNNAGALAVSEQMLAERAAEVEASRRRLVTAADEERRRLERDLHDGAQQHLVALAVLIQLARNAEQSKHQPLLAEATGLVESAIAEIRRLAHGIYPPSLVSGGLRQALSAVAAHAPIPIQLDLQDLGRYPASIEAALYFCCSEALQNAIKHGGPALPSRSPPMPTRRR